MPDPSGFGPVLPDDDFDEDAQTRISMRPEAGVDEDDGGVADSTRIIQRRKVPTFSRYRELEPRWRHPLGEVLLATDKQSGERVSLMLLNPIKTLYQDHLEAAWKTANALADLDEPNVSPILDVVHERQQLALVHPLVESSPLFQHLHRRPLAPASVVAIIRQLCHILAKVHRRGIVHGALSVGSVWLGTRNGRSEAVTLTDFGLREVLEGDIQVAPEWAALQPVAPERVLGLPRTEREDIYLLGCLGYLLLTGGAPFRTGDATAVARRHAIEEPMPIAERLRGRGLPPRPLIDVIERCLHKEAEERFASMEFVEAALLLAQAECGVQTPWDDLPLPDVSDEDRERIVAAMQAQPENRSGYISDGAPEPVELAPSRPLHLPHSTVTKQGAHVVQDLPWTDHSPFAQPAKKTPSRPRLANGMKPVTPVPATPVATPSSPFGDIAPAPPPSSPVAPKRAAFGAEFGDFEDQEVLGRTRVWPFVLAFVVLGAIATGGYLVWKQRSAPKADEPTAEVRVIHAPAPQSEAVARNVDGAQELVSQGTRAFSRKDYEAAIEHFEKAVELEPENTEYRLLLGDAYYRVERYSDARQHYDKAREFGHPAAEQRLANVTAREQEG